MSIWTLLLCILLGWLLGYILYRLQIASKTRQLEKLALDEAATELRDLMGSILPADSWSVEKDPPCCLILNILYSERLSEDSQSQILACTQYFLAKRFDFEISRVKELPPAQ